MGGKAGVGYRSMLIDEWGDSVFYQVACSCGSPDCNLLLELEHDPKFAEHLDLTIYRDLIWSSHFRKNCLWARIKGALTLLFKGRLEVAESFGLRGEEHIRSFIDALEDGIERVKEKKK
jgi:hypothetical protein